MLCLILIVGGLLIMMGQHDRSEALFYYFRLEDQVPENHLLRLIDKHISFEFVRERSRTKEYPVESALVSGEMQGWRAADSGTQTIRLIFDEPQRLTRISLVFEETEIERTQRVRLVMVFRWRKFVSRNCAPAVEFQFA